MKYTRISMSIRSFVLAFALLIVPHGGVQAAGINVVTPLNVGTTLAVETWFFMDEHTSGPGTGGYGFEVGPVDHHGSLKLTTADPTDGPYFGTMFNSFNMANLTTLTYDAYSANATGSMPTLQFEVDYDSTDAIQSWQGRLVFIPSGPFTEDTWHTFDALSDTDGSWYATGAPGNTTCPLSSPCTWNTVKTTWPNLVLFSSWANDSDGQFDLPGTGRFGFKKGSGESAPFEGYVDNLVIDTSTYDFEPVDTVYVDDTWAGTTPYDDPDGAGPATSFGVDSFDVIQDGIDAVAQGGIVQVYAGTYAEDLNIPHALSLLGPNGNINPNTGTRSAEAILYPATSNPDPSVCTVVAYLGASDITIKGFTFDGDNPTLTSGVAIGSADVDACEILAGYEGMGNITVENNILKHSTYTGIDFYNYVNKTATSNNYIRFNRIMNIGESTYNWGIGVLIYNNFYADITDNVFDNVRVGLQTGNYYQANPGTTGSISNNEINAWRLGIFHNLWYSNASTISIFDNTINAVNSADSTKFYGMLISSLQNSVNTEIFDNTITIATIAQPDTGGYNVWNTPTSAPLAISGGSVTGGQYGVFVNNYEGYSSNASNTFISIDGVTIQDTGIAGVYVKDSPSNTNDATVNAVILNSNITNANTGILVEGSNASATANFNRIFGNSTAGLTNTSGAVVDAENNWWGSNNGPYDPTGSNELPFNPEPAVANMLNVDPVGQLGNGVSDDVDYFPWESAPYVTSITLVDPGSNNAASISFTVTFSEAVTGMDVSDFVLTTTGGISANAITSLVDTGDQTTHTVTVSTGTGNGTIRLDLVDDDTIEDLLKNPLGGVGAGNGSFDSGETYTVIKGATFSDVSTSYWAWQYIERLFGATITGGCSTSPLAYCPEDLVTRAQMAVFLEKGVHYPSAFSPANLSPTFTDTVGHWAEDWIEALRSDGITGGCGTNLYCPEDPVTRAQMAVFLLKSKHGSSYVPPAMGASTGFTDVSVSHWAAPWIKQLAAEGITGGCGTGIYCPDSPVTRAQMAVFLVKTFSLP